MTRPLTPAAKECRDCRRPCENVVRHAWGRICGDCKTKYLRTKPIFNVEEILRLARAFVDAEIAAP